ncbi:40220_t:CDS:2, partial [Gigaspora margarita]
EIDNKEELDTYLSLFIAWLERKDGTPFKVESLHNCYAALARYLKESTAIPGFGNTDQSSPLTTDEITSCLKHDYLSIDDNKSLIRQYCDVERRKDSGLQLRFRKEKNNQ